MTKVATPALAKTALEQWTAEALAVESRESPVRIPLHVLFGEAVDVSRFFDAYWATKRDESGSVLRRGLETAVTKDDKRFTANTGAEILSLQIAAQEAHTAYLFSVDIKGDAIARGHFVLGEIRATLKWLFDDGVLDEDDAKLAKLDTSHARDPDSTDALASALSDYAALAEQHRAAMDGLGGFDGTLIDEAKLLAVALRAQPVTPMALRSKAADALALRNKILTLLVERMNRVRSAARFVFRAEPEIVRQATSAYERRRRAATRRAAKKKSEESTSFATIAGQR